MKKDAFTLVEIMIVIGLISLLAVLGSLAMSKGLKNARINTAKTELEMISAAVLQLAWDTGRWPNGRVRTSPGSTEIWDLRNGLLYSNPLGYVGWKGPYLDAISVDPWKTYTYFFDPDYMINGVNRIVVGSFGPNKVGRNLYDADDIYILLDD